ncbi:MAG: PDZ domain-containing protein [Alphaproteobacteria bacterium]|nr:PDZ domain-containing protein [Alphaproteobacteria bacterium]
MLGLLVLVGCGGADGARIEALERDLEAAHARIRELEAEQAETPSLTEVEREARIALLEQRMRERREARTKGGADGGAADDAAVPGEWTGPENLRAIMQGHDLEELSKMGRFLLHRGPDDAFDGYRVSAVRRGSALDRLGIRNGDIVHTINGQELTDMETLMAAFDALRADTGLKALELRMTRRGEAMSLTLDLDAPFAAMPPGGTSDEADAP